MYILTYKQTGKMGFHPGRSAPAAHINKSEPMSNPQPPNDVQPSAFIRQDRQSTHLAHLNSSVCKTYSVQAHSQRARAPYL